MEEEREATICHACESSATSCCKLANRLDKILSVTPVMPDCLHDIDDVDGVCDTGPHSLALLV